MELAVYSKDRCVSHPKRFDTISGVLLTWPVTGISIHPSALNDAETWLAFQHNGLQSFNLFYDTLRAQSKLLEFMCQAAQQLEADSQAVSVWCSKREGQQGW